MSRWKVFQRAAARRKACLIWTKPNDSYRALREKKTLEEKCSSAKIIFHVRFSRITNPKCSCEQMAKRSKSTPHHKETIIKYISDCTSTIFLLFPHKKLALRDTGDLPEGHDQQKRFVLSSFSMVLACVTATLLSFSRNFLWFNGNDAVDQ